LIFLPLACIDALALSSDGYLAVVEETAEAMFVGCSCQVSWTAFIQVERYSRLFDDWSAKPRGAAAVCQRLNIFAGCQ
jgi:hypothetical protein